MIWPINLFHSLGSSSSTQVRHQRIPNFLKILSTSYHNNKEYNRLPSTLKKTKANQSDLDMNSNWSSSNIKHKANQISWWRDAVIWNSLYLDSELLGCGELVRGIGKCAQAPAMVDKFSFGILAGGTHGHMQRVEMVRPRVGHFSIRCLLFILVHILKPAKS